MKCTRVEDSGCIQDRCTRLAGVRACALSPATSSAVSSTGLGVAQGLVHCQRVDGVKVPAQRTVQRWASPVHDSLCNVTDGPPGAYPGRASPSVTSVTSYTRVEADDSLWSDEVETATVGTRRAANKLSLASKATLSNPLYTGLPNWLRAVRCGWRRTCKATYGVVRLTSCSSGSRSCQSCASQHSINVPSNPAASSDRRSATEKLACHPDATRCKVWRHAGNTTPHRARPSDVRWSATNSGRAGRVGCTDQMSGWSWFLRNASDG